MQMHNYKALWCDCLVAMGRNTLPDGIESMDENARFVGNGMKRDEWDKAAVWSPTPIEVAEGVKIVNQYEADGTAPAVSKDEARAVANPDSNEEVAGMMKYELER